MYNKAEIEERIKELQEKFKMLQERAIDEFERGKVQMEIVLYELTTLPPGEFVEHETFFDKHLDDLEKCTRYRPLFSRLNRHWNYLSPQLLNRISYLQCAGARGKMDSYNTKLAMFRSQTLLELFCEIDCQHIEPPEKFSTIKARFDKENVPKGPPTLQDVEDFRWRYARHHKLREFALMLVSSAQTDSDRGKSPTPLCKPSIMKDMKPTAEEIERRHSGKRSPGDLSKPYIKKR